MARLATVGSLVASVASGAVLLAPGSVVAREDVAPEAPDPDPVVVSVRGKLAANVARLVVRYTVAVDGPAYERGRALLDLPETAAVTGARVTRGGVTRRLDLMTAPRADDRFDALGGEEVGRGLPTSAVMLAGEGGRIELSIASPLPGRLGLELDVEVTTCFLDDVRYVRVPTAWAAASDPALRPRTPAPVRLAEACDDGTPPGAWLAFPSRELRRRPSSDRIGAFAARLDAGDDHLVRVELDVAGVLSDVPRDLATVIVVDASRSMTADELESQRAIVDAYLARARDTRVQVITYARTASPLLPGWTPASHARTRIDRELRALRLRNGSNFDVGLTEAATWLARIEGTRRIILVTDERLADRLSEASPVTFRRLLPPNTLVHVVATGGDGELRRDAEAALAPLAAATDGMSVRVGPVDGPVDATMLVRPTSLDEVTVRAPGWAQAAFTTPSCGDQDRRVEEGRACTWWGHGDAVSGPIVLEGLVWGQRFVRVLRPDPARGTPVARELMTSHDLGEPLRARVQELARAVNDHWSLYAAWGGAGRYEGGLGMISGSSCCGSRFSTVGHTVGVGSIGSHIPTPDLRPQLEPAIAHCGLGTLHARVKLEMTGLEIVGIEVTVDALSATSPNATRRAEACITEALWETAPMLPRPVAHASYTVRFGG